MTDFILQVSIVSGTIITALIIGLLFLRFLWWMDKYWPAYKRLLRIKYGERK